MPRKNSKKSYSLVIVESPGKIKKLESILGDGYMVVPSYGHIMDLHPGKLSVDIGNNFEPEYFIMSTGVTDKRKIVDDLRAKVKNAKKVLVASDSDREGEMIGWSYITALNLNDYERIRFNSITSDEVKKAINNPGKIDNDMVESQKTRRILDRIVGFKISPVLNRILGMSKLSAGRVQSIVVELICDKEKEIESFFQNEKSSYFKIIGSFSTNESQSLDCVLCKRRKKKSLITLTLIRILLIRAIRSKSVKVMHPYNHTRMHVI